MANVVMVDDEVVFCKTIEKQLIKNGDSVTAYTHPEKMLMEEKWKDADVLVLDVSMPKLDGIELALRLRRWGYAGRMIFVTGVGADLFKPWLAALQPCITLSKPFRIEDLQLKIRGE